MAATLPAASPPRADNAPYRVMVVDDSAVIRGIFRRTLEDDPAIKVVATAGNGQAAIDALKGQEIDVIVLDIEMPVMDGLTALPKLLKAAPNVKVIMASTLTRENADISLKALSLGAADYIPKPTSKLEIHSAKNFQRDLRDKVRALGARRRGETRRSGRVDASPAARPAQAAIALRAPAKVAPRILAIGSSTGGPQALVRVLGELRGNLDLPIVVTQHMPKTFTAILAEHLTKASGRTCAEAVDGEPIVAGRVYVAPGDQHMEVAPGPNAQPVIRLTRNPPENFCRPAVDPMFRSLAAVYGGKVLAVVLTGMGQDGLDGGKALAQAGATLIAQDEASSVVWGMPGAVANAGLCAAVLPLGEIAAKVRNLAGRQAP
ncbi:MAG: chemotaxis response regulator protein-glutamate methylesterase [Rhodospirillales bacterium]